MVTEYAIYPEWEADGPGNGWWQCAPEDAECWSVWELEDGEPMTLLAAFDTEAEAKAELDLILEA